MNRLGAFGGLLLVGSVLVVISSLCFAEDIDVQWLVGTWKGIIGGDRREVVFKADGTWTGDLQSSATGLITQSGTYVIKGGAVSLDGKNQYGRLVGFSLARNREVLAGTVQTAGPEQRVVPITLTRAK
jgi:hypothetical protein